MAEDDDIESYWADLRPARREPRVEAPQAPAPQAAPTSRPRIDYRLHVRELLGWPRAPLPPPMDMPRLPAFIQREGTSVIQAPAEALNGQSNASFVFGTRIADALHLLRYVPDVAALVRLTHDLVHPEFTPDDEGAAANRLIEGIFSDTSAPIIGVFVGPGRRRGDRAEHPYATHFALTFWDDTSRLVSLLPSGMLIEHRAPTDLPHGVEVHYWATRAR